MRLGDLALSLLPPGDAGAEVAIAGITADSREVKPGYVFAALPGTKVDGARFAADAIAKGAAAILVDRTKAADVTALAGSVPVLAVDDPRHHLAVLAARLTGPQPATIAAVTGTSGKTSVAAFTRQIWQANGLDAASIGTLGVITAAGERYGSLTTPDPVTLARHLTSLKAEGIEHVALEASSHGLDMRRLDGVTIAAAGFTNLSRDHLDYHPTFEDYFQAKLRLFDTLLPSGKPAVVDVDRPEGQRVVDTARAHGHPILTVGAKGETLRLVSVVTGGKGQILTIDAGAGVEEIELPLVGTFQVSNALVAAGLTIATGLKPTAALAALAGLVGAPGRLDRIGTSARGATAFVDYAHKPDALEKAIEALRPFASGKLICVFGCGGDRDPGKRPIMGRISVERADVTIVTDDNPRTEVPADIRRQILADAPGALEIGDRAEAIRAAVRMAGPGDVILVAGKGHEPGQIVGTTVLPFSDHEAVRAALAEDH
jgi:UDP-N-acetylmuramoyl-L-alanyl-D-glutamate--2,6-diaminopimelate ligase